MSEAASEVVPNIIHAHMCDGCGTILEENRDYISDDEFAAKQRENPNDWYKTKPDGYIVYRHTTEQKTCRWC